MNVSTARTADLKDLLELVAEYQELDETIDKVDVAQNERYLSEILANERLGTIFLGRTSSGQPVGFISIFLTPSTLHAEQFPRIQDLFVSVPHRENGFGRQLFDHALRWARKRKHRRIVWFIKNMDVTAQYLFDPYDTKSAGWVGYTLDLN
ncbi:GNAT family N-acetyltransferase [candidate division KSB1 bacterium]|nr:GNAT family N-acetyltransferase [candidate division KSB1 bacterium]